MTRPPAVAPVGGAESDTSPTCPSGTGTQRGQRAPSPSPSKAVVGPTGDWWDRHAAYQSPGVWAEERRLVWRPSWQAVAVAGDLGAHGAFATVTPCGEPVVLVRDGETIRALRNVCRHRLMRLCEGTGTASSLRCSYHGWRYGLDGALQAVPQRSSQFPGLDPHRLALESFPARCWSGLVLVRLAAPTGTESSAGEPWRRLEPAVARHLPQELPVIGRQRLVARCNWKLLVENHIDAYHLWYLHQDSLDDYDHRAFDARWWPDGTWMSWEPCRQAISDRPGLVAVPGAPAVMGAHLLFPGLLVVTSPWWLATYWLDPVAPERTEVHLVVRGPAGSDPDALVADVRHFVDQDVWACEAVQEALAAGDVPEGPLAAGHEAHVVAFRRLVCEVLGGVG